MHSLVHPYIKQKKPPKGICTKLVDIMVVQQKKIFICVQAFDGDFAGSEAKNENEEML